MSGRIVIVLAALRSLCACLDGAAEGADVDTDEVADLAEPGSDTTVASDTVAHVDTVAPEDTHAPEDILASEDSATPSDVAADTTLETTAPDVEPAGDTSPQGDGSATCPEECAARRPLVLVHGINGSPANFDVMAARLIADGWPADWVVRFEAEDPAWGCNVDNAAAIAALVESVRASTCQPRVDIVAHSMGTLSSRYYLKNLGGAERVNTYVTLGGMHHGLLSPCFAPDFLGVCVWKELCQWGELITQLNADPATPGELHWVSIYGTADETVSNESSHLEGAENLVIEGAEHDGENGLLQREDAYAEVLRVLGYPCW